MAHGAPDYSNVKKDGFVFRIDDMAELAVRLGSIVSYDRRGDVYWFYGFDYGIGDLLESTVGASSTVSLRTDFYEHPPFACRLTAGGDAGNYATISRRLATPSTVNVGTQVSIRPSSSSADIRLYIENFNGTSRFRSKLRLNPQVGTLQIEDDTEGWVTIATGLPAFTSIAHFIHMKVIMDITTNKYVKAVLDDTEYDISDYDAAESSSSISKSILASVYNLSTESGNDSINVDNLIVTINE